MGMRTIRWRNGQCPGRNGQWAERIAHAGSEAVRLVPFCEAEELSSRDGINPHERDTHRDAGFC